MFRPLAAALACAAAVSALAGAPAALAETVTVDSSAGPLRVERFAGPMEHPWAIAFLPGDAFGGGLLATERTGRLQLIDPEGEMTEVWGVPPVYDVGQGGLLDVALSRNFAESGVLFISYAEPTADGARTAVARARLVRDGADAAPRLDDLRVIFEMEPTVSGGRHFGSRIVVDADGSLFVTTGDRARRPLSQEMNTHIGKVLRISPSGGAVADNPFVGRAQAQPEIWSLGHRNIQGATLDPETGALWTVEHGARGGDELNQPRAGRNYGWPIISYGRHYSGLPIGEGVAKPGLEQPVYYWDPSIAPSGLAIYDGDMFPSWKGDAFVGALKDRLIARLDRDDDGRIVGEERLFEGRFGRIRDVRVGPEGGLWFVTDDPEGHVYRVTPGDAS